MCYGVCQIVRTVDDHDTVWMHPDGIVELCDAILRRWKFAGDNVQPVDADFVRAVREFGVVLQAPANFRAGTRMKTLEAVLNQLFRCSVLSGSFDLVSCSLLGAVHLPQSSSSATVEGLSSRFRVLSIEPCVSRCVGDDDGNDGGLPVAMHEAMLRLAGAVRWCPSLRFAQDAIELWSSIEGEVFSCLFAEAAVVRGW